MIDPQAALGTSPVVEIDSEAHAAYLRFTDHAVAETRPMTAEDCMVTVDFDAGGKVVGVELLGVREFGVDKLYGQALASVRACDRQGGV